MKRKVLISACCTGVKCRYSGEDKLCTEFENLKKKCDIIKFCPEIYGGLSTPRSPAEIIGGDGYDVVKLKAKVMDRDGNDVTDSFMKGAKKALEICKENGIKKAYLASGSPSCGCGIIYDGSFTGTKKEGDGVTAALLKMNGIEVISI